MTPDAGPAPRRLAPAMRALPVVEPRRMARTDDRRITFVGLSIAAALAGLSLISFVLPEPVRRGTWLPLHLALAGAASTAIASLLPFFTAALAGAPPAGRPTRVAAIGGIAGGALVVSGGVAAGVPAVAVGGGLAYLGGLAAVAAAAFPPLRGALGPRRPLVTGAYGVALASVAVGVAIATAFLAGWTPLLERWPLVKPAHAWLNLVGFVSVVIAASLIHLAPTVVGARIRPRASGWVAIGGLTIGTVILAGGLVLASDAATRVGALGTIVGALALVAHGVAVHQDRGRWTTDPAWHRLTSWSLLLAPPWFAIGIGVAAGRFVILGADPSAWDAGMVAPALVLGWVAQVLIGSWTHLLPAIGPGDPAAHARQRALLGRGATGRIVALDGGTAVATVGIWLDVPAALAAGLAAAGVAVAIALATFAAARLAGVDRPSPF